MSRTGRPRTTFESLYVPVTESGCWIWMGGFAGDTGYGFYSAGRHSGEKLAHRHSWSSKFGPIPKGLCVCHRCDVPTCVNPAHLFLGTSADNTADMVSKGRQTRGTKVRTARLNENQVRTILASDETCYALAERFGVTDVAISYIKLGKTWKHVERPEGYKYIPRRSLQNNRWANRG